MPEDEATVAIQIEIGRTHQIGNTSDKSIPPALAVDFLDRPIYKLYKKPLTPIKYDAGRLAASLST